MATERVTKILKIEEIEDSPHRDRDKEPTAEEMTDLRDSLKKHGMLHRPLVRPIEKKTVRGITITHQFVHGHCRRDAWKNIGHNTIEVEVRNLTELEAAELTITENAQRIGISDHASAQAVINLQRLGQEAGQTMSPARLSSRLGKSLTWVRNRLLFEDLHPRLLKVAKKHENVLSALHYAQRVAGKVDDDTLNSLAEAIENGISFRPLKKWVDEIEEELKKKKKASQTAPDKQTQSRSSADASGQGGNVSRGRQVTGHTQTDVKAQVVRHLKNLESWAEHLSDSNFEKIVVPAVQRLLKSRK